MKTCREKNVSFQAKDRELEEETELKPEKGGIGDRLYMIKIYKNHMIVIQRRRAS